MKVLTQAQYKFLLRHDLSSFAGRCFQDLNPQTCLATDWHLEDAPFQARENVGIVAARGRMLSSVRPLMRQDDSRRPVWEFADRVQITRSVLEAQWKALVVPAPSRRLLRHTLLPLALTSSRSWSAYAATAGVL